jgi:hypothetical protein
MSVTQRNIFEPPAGGTPSGNAASSDPAVDPWTGKPFGTGRINQHTPEPAPRLSTAGQFDSAQQTKLNAIEAESRRATTASSRISPLDSGAGGMTVGGSGPSSNPSADDYDAASLRRFGEINPQDNGSGGIAI